MNREIILSKYKNPKLKAGMIVDKVVGEPPQKVSKKKSKEKKFRQILVSKTLEQH